MHLKRPAIYLSALTLSWLMIVLAILPPFVSGPWVHFLFETFDKLCHQLPGRSLHLDGQALAVCARCSAIYFGVAAGLSVYPLLKDRFHVSRALILGVVSALGIQWIIEFIWPGEAWLLIRMATGLLIGLLGGFILARATLAILTSPDPLLTIKPVIQ